MDYIHPPDAPGPVGPYSQAAVYGGLASGQIPLDPETGKLCGSSIEEQAEQLLRNLQGVCAPPGRGGTGSCA